MLVNKENISEKQSGISKPLLFLMASSCGIAVANLYYIQPLLAEIARSFKVSQVSIGAAAMLTQIGYAAGMFFFVPMGDIKERRALIVTMLFLTTIALVLMGSSINISMIIFACFTVGFTSVVPQLIMPFAAHLAKPKERGEVLGFVMSGLLIGILLSRTFSGIIGSLFGWRIVYFIAAAMMILLAVLLKALLPVSPSASDIRYSELLKSMWRILRKERVLQQASISGAALFAAFSTFWTTLTFLLESPAYHLGTEAAGLFGLVGVTGALAAPRVGRIADKRGARFAVGVAIGISALSYICFWALGLKIWGLIIGVILLDLGTQAGQVSNLARIHALSSEMRNRINTIFMVSYFLGGSLGSFLGAYCWAHYGWNGVCILGLLFELIAVGVYYGNKIKK